MSVFSQCSEMHCRVLASILLTEEIFLTNIANLTEEITRKSTDLLSRCVQNVHLLNTESIKRIFIVFEHKTCAVKVVSLTLIGLVLLFPDPVLYLV